MARLKLDQWGSRWSFARGATKANTEANGRAMTELTDALAEVDGLFAGISYLEKQEPESEEPPPPPSPSARSENANNYSTSTPPESAWFGRLNIDLPHLDPLLDSEERSKTEARHLRNYLNGKLGNSKGNSSRLPRESQWATLRSLRKASMYHYHQFVKLTADSPSQEIRKLRKSYVTAKNMLEMGIQTFRDVLHNQIPTTLMEIFAFASLSYMISKTLHAKGHLDESDILSGLLDWRAAITEEKEKLAFDQIAKLLWPETKKILHFIPLQTLGTSTGTAGLGFEGREPMHLPWSRPKSAMDAVASTLAGENFTLREDPLQSPPWLHAHTSILQASTAPITCHGEVVANNSDGLQGHVRQLLQETRSHEEFMFSDFIDFDTILQGSIDPLLCPITPPDVSLQVLNQPSSQTEYSVDASPILSESPSSPRLHLEGRSLGETIDQPTSDDLLNRLIDTPLFQVVFGFIIHLSEVGDLLKVLSGGITSGENEIKSSPPRQPWVVFEFLDQTRRIVFGPLHRAAVQVDDIFSGIVAMAETFVRLGFLQTVREVENYIITVGRYLAPSRGSFMSLVSKTLVQCLIASESMKWNLLYPNCTREQDEYSIEYMDKRKKGEEELADTLLAPLEPSEDIPSLTLSTSTSHPKHPPNSTKRLCNDEADAPHKPRRRDVLGNLSRSPPSESDAPAVEHCRYENCSKSFTGRAARSNLCRHVRTKHKMKLLGCPNCHKEMDRRDNLRQHFRTVHTNYELPDWLANKERSLF